MKKLILVVLSMYLIIVKVPFAAAEQNHSSYSALFEEIVNIVETHFYNPDQIAKDFPAIKAGYRIRLKNVPSQKAFSNLVNRMLDELNASHTYYLTPDDYEYYQLCALFSKIPAISRLFDGKEVLYPSVGILTQDFGNRVHIVSVLAGSVAEKAGLLKGDEIISANGAPYLPITSLHSNVGKNVVFKIRRKEMDKPFTVLMQPVLVNPKQEMLEAQKSSIRIIEQNETRVGYVHIYSYAGYEYHQELLNAISWGKLKEADALIIDLRYGLGGAAPSYLNIFNTNIPVLKMYHRDGTVTVFDSQWRKQAVYLVNNYSRSGKELLAYGARRYRQVKVIGERTAGDVLGGRLFPLSNGDTLFLAVQSALVDGVNLEGIGVPPDIEVPFDVPYCAGQDAQLEKAFEHLVKQPTR